MKILMFCHNVFDPFQQKMKSTGILTGKFKKLSNTQIVSMLSRIDS